MMLRNWAALCLLLLGSSSGCAGSGSRSADYPIEIATQKAGNPPPVPKEPLRVPSITALEPGHFATGRIPALREALGTRTKVMLVLGDKLATLDLEKRASELVRTLNSKARILARANDTLGVLMRERGEMPAFTTPSVGPPDVFGRPTIVPREHLLQTEWLGQAKKLHGAEVGLWIDVVPLDAQRLQAFRQKTVGGCQAALEEIEAAQSAEKERTAVFAAYVNAALLEAFQREVKSLVDQAEVQLAEFGGPERTRLSFGSEPDYRRYDCGRSYRALIEEAAGCRSAGCSGTPVFVVEGALWMGLVGPEVRIARECPEMLGRDWQRDLEDVARKATRSVAQILSHEWLARVSAVGALRDVGVALGQACAPKRGRVAVDQAQAASRLVAEVLAKVARIEVSSSDAWREERVDRFAPGSGPAVQLMSYSSAMEETAVRVRKAMEPLGQRRCSSRLEQPIAITLIDIGTSETLFFDYFFEEELFCEDLGPLGL